MISDDLKKIKQYYDNNPEREWTRLDRYRFEFPIVTKHMENIISKPKSKILDIGGGPGRYAFHLAGLGHCVSLCDLSDENIKLAKQKSIELDIQLCEYSVRNATDLSKWDDSLFDYVINFGPLYHISNTIDRKRIKEESLRVLKPNGIAFFAFISKYAPVYDAIKKIRNNYNNISVDKLIHLVNDEQHKESISEQGFTDSVFIDPQYIKDEFSEHQCSVVKIFGAESLFDQSEYFIYDYDKSNFNKWINLAYELSETNAGIFGAQHIIAVIKKES